MILLPPTPEYAGLFALWLNDTTVVRFSEQRHKVHTVQSQLDYWRSTATAAPNQVLVIFLENPLRPIGSVSAVIDPNNNVANVGILIGDLSESKRGHGFQAWSKFCNKLFQGGIRKVEAGCMSLNKPMRRICEKYGMILEGGQRSHFQIDGGTDDLVWYGKLK